MISKIMSLYNIRIVTVTQITIMFMKYYCVPRGATVYVRYVLHVIFQITHLHCTVRVRYFVVCYYVNQPHVILI